MVSVSEYEIKDGVLKVMKDLRRDFDLSFDRACSDLLNRPQVDLRIDLSQVSYVNSTYIGMIAATYFQAQASNKTLTVLAQPNVLQVLRAAGFEGFIQLEEA